MHHLCVAIDNLKGTDEPFFWNPFLLQGTPKIHDVNAREKNPVPRTVGTYSLALICTDDTTSYAVALIGHLDVT